IWLRSWSYRAVTTDTVRIPSTLISVLFKTSFVFSVLTLLLLGNTERDTSRGSAPISVTSLALNPTSHFRPTLTNEGLDKSLSLVCELLVMCRELPLVSSWRAKVLLVLEWRAVALRSRLLR